MAAKKKDELKKNELADIIEAKLDAIKPYSGAIGIVVVLLVAVVGGGIWMVVRNQKASEQAWADLYQASYQAQFEDSADLLKVSEKDTPAGLWARQFAADFHMNEGSREVFKDREAGLKKINLAKEDFQYIVDKVDKSKQKLLWSRASFGRARALESLGEFEEAKKVYESLASDLKDSVIGDAAAEGVTRVSNATTVAWYKAFKTREKDDLLSMMTAVGEAPDSDTGLPARPDFSYPEIIVPAPGSANEDAPPTPPDGTTNEEAPPAPPEGDAKDDAKKSDLPVDEDAPKKVEPKSDEDEAADSKDKN